MEKLKKGKRNENYKSEIDKSIKYMNDIPYFKKPENFIYFLKDLQENNKEKFLSEFNLNSKKIFLLIII